MLRLTLAASLLSFHSYRLQVSKTQAKPQLATVVIKAGQGQRTNVTDNAQPRAASDMPCHSGLLAAAAAVVVVAVRLWYCCSRK